MVPTNALKVGYYGYLMANHL